MSMNESFSSVSEPETTIEYVSAPIETFVRSVGRETASLRVVVGVDAAIEFLSLVDSLDPAHANGIRIEQIAGHCPGSFGNLGILFTNQYLNLNFSHLNQCYPHRHSPEI